MEFVRWYCNLFDFIINEYHEYLNYTSNRREVAFLKLTLSDEKIIFDSYYLHF